MGDGIVLKPLGRNVRLLNVNHLTSGLFGYNSLRYFFTFFYVQHSPSGQPVPLKRSTSNYLTLTY